jgi:hypothetical protein
MPARLAVFDLQGRKLATLLDRVIEPGAQELTWDRSEASGHRSKSGIYFARFDSEGHSFTKRFVLVR